MLSHFSLPKCRWSRREWNLKSIENDKFIELFSPPFSQRISFFSQKKINENKANENEIWNFSSISIELSLILRWRKTNNMKKKSREFRIVLKIFFSIHFSYIFSFKCFASFECSSNKKIYLNFIRINEEKIELVLSFNFNLKSNNFISSRKNSKKTQKTEFYVNFANVRKEKTMKTMNMTMMMMMCNYMRNGKLLRKSVSWEMRWFLQKTTIQHTQNTSKKMMKFFFLKNHQKKLTNIKFQTHSFILISYLKRTMQKWC